MTALVERYTRPAIWLHWIIGILMIVNLALGFFFESFGEENVRPLINNHKSIGIAVLGLAIMRLLWRLTHRPPALPTAYQRWEKMASHAVHGLLYALIFALPITGWMHDSAWKKAPEIKMYWFGLFEWPRIGWIMNLDPARKEMLHDIYGGIHESLGFVLIALLVLHIGGALKHQFIDKHPELQRMWR
jgi:cytochrome b561